ncbi:potassium channel family protein [Halorarius litoreus]|uniref:potassium channel family protein n=1 Tax=Halorarius litoreus TaxID=2962676 RepID=UPI0020CCC3AC|nr:NAD-binding protein [Halorarius litoreus]
MDPRRLFSADRQRRLIVVYMLGVNVVALLFAAGYVVLVSTFEGVDVTYIEALLVVVESFTTTGYGEASRQWTSPIVQIYLILMMIVGVALIFTALPVFAGPYVENRLSTRPPAAVHGFEDHVVLAGFTSRGQSLIDELQARDRPYLVIEPDGDRASDLYKDGVPVIHGEPDDEQTLENACVHDARALIADIDDGTNASIALIARALDDVPVITFVEDDETARYHRYAGATEAFIPKTLIADGLAKKVTAGVTPELDDAVVIDEDFDVVELPVQAGSELEGVTVRGSGIRERTGTNLIGAWFRGEFVSPPPPQERIDAQTILVAAGREDQLEALKELTLSERRQRREGHVIIGGYGKVGSTVAERLDEADVETVVVDIRDAEGVDVVGDVTEDEVLVEAGIGEASMVILATSDDTEEVFGTLVARDVAPEVEIIARADATESVKKLYLAGADYVLAVATVAGRMLASTVLNEEVISFDKAVELVRVDCGSLAGKSLGGADIRARTGVTVVAVERDGESITDLGPEFTIREGDMLIVAGTDDDVNRFANLAD